VEDFIVFVFADWRVAVLGIVGTVPVILPFWGVFLEDDFAVRTEDVVAETKVSVEHHGPFGHRLETVLTLLFVWAMHFSVFV